MKLDPDESNAVHAERIRELTSGEISGKEFVQSLIDQVGFSQVEAREQWQALKDQGVIAIYNIAKSGVDVNFPMPVKTFHTHGIGKIVSMYGSDLGAIVCPEGMAIKLPFSLFELRLAK